MGEAPPVPGAPLLLFEPAAPEELVLEPALPALEGLPALAAPAPPGPSLELLPQAVTSASPNKQIPNR
jgi:hypothetical protein